jgi:hypothetical protein
MQAELFLFELTLCWSFAPNRGQSAGFGLTEADSDLSKATHKLAKQARPRFSQLVVGKCGAC